MEPLKVKFIIVDFAETDNCIAELIKASDETPNIDNKEVPLYMTQEKFMLNYNITLQDLVTMLFNQYNISYNLEITDDELSSICKDFIEFMHNIRNEQIYEDNFGMIFSDIYDNKITKYAKENNKKIILKLHLLSKYTFVSIIGCFIKVFSKINNTDETFRVFMRV